MDSLVGPVVDPLIDPTARPTVNEGWDGFDGPAFVDSELDIDLEDSDRCSKCANGGFPSDHDPSACEGVEP